MSGVVLFARTSKALERLNKMFQEHEKEITKIYWAIVGNLPEEDHGMLTHYLTRDPSKNKSHAYNQPKPGSKEAKLSNKSHAYNQPKPGSKEAKLAYRLIGRSQRYYLLEITLYTGRHHQIRCQLAKIGCPIKGDLKYGFPRSNENGGPARPFPHVQAPGQRGDHQHRCPSPIGRQLVAHFLRRIARNGSFIKNLYCPIKR